MLLLNTVRQKKCDRYTGTEIQVNIVHHTMSRKLMDSRSSTDKFK